MHRLPQSTVIHRHCLSQNFFLATAPATNTATNTLRPSPAWPLSIYFKMAATDAKFLASLETIVLGYNAL